MLALFTWFVSVVEVRDIFPNISPTMIELLTFGRDLGPGLLVLLGWSLALGVIGGAVHLIPSGFRRSVVRAVAWILGAGPPRIRPLDDPRASRARPAPGLPLRSDRRAELRGRRGGRGRGDRDRPVPVATPDHPASPGRHHAVAGSEAGLHPGRRRRPPGAGRPPAPPRSIPDRGAQPRRDLHAHGAGPQHRRGLRRPPGPGLRGVLRGRGLLHGRLHVTALATVLAGASLLGGTRARAVHGGGRGRVHRHARCSGCAATTWRS